MKPPIALAEAQQTLLDGYGLLGTQRVALAEASGRVLAEPIVAGHDQPLCAMSAMDGYAVRSADVVAGASFKLVGQAPAGAPFSGIVGPGETVRIATGGCIPDGADRVVIQENVDIDGDQVVVRDPAGPAFIRPAGMDFKAGQLLLEAGARLSPATLGLAAAAGWAELVVARRPRVAILTCGDELREPGATLAPGLTYNSGAYALAGLIDEWGGVPSLQPIIPDERAATLASIAGLDRGTDVIAAIGGASVGERDVLRAAFAAAGAEHRFWRIAVVPGKPSWHARMSQGRPVLGLPGNPSSSFVCAHLLLKPLLYALTGRDPLGALKLSTARLAEPLAANGAREAWLRATVSNCGGAMVAAVGARQDSGLQLPLAAANALVRRAAGAGPAEKNAEVEFLPLGWPAGTS
ncbi:MAG: molybdopterin molybdotransferase MoeA [Sphingomicrobium sp.]